MTAIYYRDRVARSANEEFELEARSPHNGSISHADGRAPTDDEYEYKYRSHQSEFRYRLIERATGAVVWERWQPRGEDSPGELFVANDGWSVIQTYGFRPAIIGVRPDGLDALHVRVEPPWGNPNRPDAPAFSPTVSWVAEQMSDTTAGYWWTFHDWPYFATSGPDQLFVWRASWGQRLVMNLTRACVVAETPKLARGLNAAEKRGAKRLLEKLTARAADLRRLYDRSRDDEDTPLAYDWLQHHAGSLSAAVHLVGVHGEADCVPLLREWEKWDRPGSSTSSHAFTQHIDLHTQLFRPIIRHSLRRLGQVPGPYPAYTFRRNGRSPGFKIPAAVADRAEKLAGIQQSMTAAAVLQLVGVPDHVCRVSFDGGWGEQWEYDHYRNGRWATRYVQWQGEYRAPELAAVVNGPPDRAVSDDRASDILGL